MELATQPAPGLEILTGFGFIDPELEEFLDPVNGGMSDIAKFQFTPKCNFIGSLRHTLPPLDFGTLTLRVDYFATSSFDFLVLADDRIDQSKYFLVNARLGLAEVDLPGFPGRSSVYLWGRNLMDPESRDGGIDWGGVGILTNNDGDPRTFGIGATFRWGAGES